MCAQLGLWLSGLPANPRYIPHMHVTVDRQLEKTDEPIARRLSWESLYKQLILVVWFVVP